MKREDGVIKWESSLLTNNQPGQSISANAQLRQGQAPFDEPKAARWRSDLFNKLLTFLLAMFLALSSQLPAMAQSNLPVYRVVQSGASISQANLLASLLNVPTNLLLFTNGQVSFLSSNFLRVPSTTVTDPATISNLLANTTNLWPPVPIRFQQTDFGALTNLPILGSNAAAAWFSNALSTAGLVPQTIYYGGLLKGTPVPFNTIFSGYYSNGPSVISATHALDTEVVYRMYDTNGYSFVGPGVQAQVALDGNTNVTRLFYSAPQLALGPSVHIIPASEISNRVARLWDPTGTRQLAIQQSLVYYVPGLHWTNPCIECPPPSVTNFVLPWYECVASEIITNPANGLPTTMHLLGTTVPATDDSSFVPTAVLLANYDTNTAQVTAIAGAAGGQPPYSYLWSVPGVTSISNNSAILTYTPTTRVALPTLNITRSAVDSLRLEWLEPDPMPWLIQSCSNLRSNIWTTLTDLVQSSNGLNTATVFTGGTNNSLFFRLISAGPRWTHFENVGVTITDANGVSFNTNILVQVQSTLITPAFSAYAYIIGYGSEGPYDEFAADQAGFRNGMATPNAGGGTEHFSWSGLSAWPGDFIEPPTPGVLPNSPQIYGDADYANWGVNTASIVFYVGHGDPSAISFTYPQSPTNTVWGSLLFDPANNPTVAVWPTGAAAAQDYEVNYKGSWKNWGGPGDQLDWLCLLSCDVLSTNPPAETRWGAAFNGLHMLTGFRTLAWGGSPDFSQTFASAMLGVNNIDAQPMPIITAWWNAALLYEERDDDQNGPTGRAAIIGPYGPLGVCDSGDFYWGKGSVGPTITAGQITGWWHIDQP
jgi:hypothetical protein